MDALPITAILARKLPLFPIRVNRKSLGAVERMLKSPLLDKGGRAIAAALKRKPSDSLQLLGQQQLQSLASISAPFLPLPLSFSICHSHRKGYPPSGLHASPHRPSSIPSDRERYLAELLAEKQKLGPFMQILPLCTRLLNQEIRRVSGLNPGFADHERFEHDSPLRSLGQHPNGRQMDMNGWSVMQTEENGHLQRVGSIQDASMGWPGLPGVPTTPIVKRYNFVGRILGPRGNSLKRVEAVTECRVYIRGKGSVKDAVKEEKLKDKPGYEHLNEQLHVLLEAEFPEDVINSRLEYAVGILENLLKPVDESLDNYKKQQLRELALLNVLHNDGSPISVSFSVDPCFPTSHPLHGVDYSASLVTTNNLLRNYFSHVLSASGS
ncbi:hypothetical protein V6N12_056101 [Hibiscus sabdariffa]|uniref:K Homology domain-containing protein n=1 Tax=Hibiscus sabdariffa TaxID=183260 RepID=A0ABR2CRI7_9ROSI